MECPDCIDMSEVQGLLPCPQCHQKPTKCVKLFWGGNRGMFLPIFHCLCGWTGPYVKGHEIEQWNKALHDDEQYKE